MKGGPADAANGEVFDSELARDITRSLEHTLLEGGPRDIQTSLVFEASNTRSPSPILPDSVRRGGVREYRVSDVESTTAGPRATLEPKRLVNGSC